MVAAAVNIASIAGSRLSTLTQRANDILAEFKSIVPYRSAEIAIWSTKESRHVTVAEDNYSSEVLEGLNGNAFTEDACWPELQQDRRLRRWKDLQLDLHSSSFYCDLLLPNGYLEGLYVPLFHKNRYRGMFTLNTDDWKWPSEDSVEIATLLVPALSGFLEDVYNQDMDVTVAAPVRQGTLDTFLRPLGTDVETGERIPDTLWKAAQRVLREGYLPLRFLVWPPENVDPFHVTAVLNQEKQDCILLTWTEDPVPYGLSRRELDVIAGLVDGLPSAEIGRRLFMSPRTVTTHVEHIMAKLRETSRTAVAKVALLEGLYTGSMA